MELYCITLLTNIVESQPLVIVTLLKTEMTKSKDFTQYLVKLLLDESASMISDMLATDEGMAGSINTSAKATLSDDRLPIAEIVMSAHISLILVTIVINVERSQQRELSNAVKAKLPKKTWWLLIRVLKAFIVLQGKTGVLLRDNMQSILSSIKFMENDDAMIITSEISRVSELPGPDLSYHSPSRSRLQRTGVVDWLSDASPPGDRKRNISASKVHSRPAILSPDSTVKVSPESLRRNKVSVWASALPIRLNNDEVSDHSSTAGSDQMISWTLSIDVENKRNLYQDIPMQESSSISSPTPTTAANVTTDVVTPEVEIGSWKSKEDFNLSTTRVKAIPSITEYQYLESRQPILPVASDKAISACRPSKVVPYMQSSALNVDSPISSVPAKKYPDSKNRKSQNKLASSLSQERFVASITIEAPNKSTNAAGLSWKSKRKFTKPNS